MTEIKKKKRSWQPLIYCGLVALGLFGGSLLKRQVPDKFTELLDIISAHYVDTLNYTNVEDRAFNQFLKTLDPHSTYISAGEARAALEPLEGNFEGIGVEFYLFNDTIMLANVIPGGPSEKTGLQAGDKILEANGRKLTGDSITNDIVIRTLKGPRGSKVNVKILRKGVAGPLDFAIHRGVIPIFSIDAAFMVNNTTGFVRISRFGATTVEEFRSALQDLKKQGMTSLVLDLRDNPGGYLVAATGVLDEFLGRQKLLVYTEGRHDHRKEYFATNEGLFEQGRLTVLVDESSASASEIVAGALQDWDRAVIVGRRTYGKGLVQEPYELNDGSIIRLTVSRYHTPSGRYIQKSYGNGYDAYQHELSDRYMNGEMEEEYKIQAKDSVNPFKTNGGRKVYGGGGVQPDVFVKLDTSMHTPLMMRCYKETVFKHFCLEYLQLIKPIKVQYATFQEFGNNYEVSEALLAQFIGYMQERKIAYSQEELNASLPFMGKMLKSSIAMQLYGTKGYYYTESRIDPEILAAVRALDQYTALLPH